MSKYRCLVNLKLKDGRKVSPSTGIFECSDVEAVDLVKNGWIVSATAPVGAGVAEETINKQAEEIESLKKKLDEKDKQIVQLQNIITAKEADIDKLNKAATAGGKTK